MPSVVAAPHRRRGEARDLSFILAHRGRRSGAPRIVARVFADDSFLPTPSGSLGAAAEVADGAARPQAELHRAERMTLRDFVDYETERHLKIAAGADTRGVPRVRREAKPVFQ